MSLILGWFRQFLRQRFRLQASASLPGLRARAGAARPGIIQWLSCATYRTGAAERVAWHPRRQPRQQPPQWDGPPHVGRTLTAGTSAPSPCELRAALAAAARFARRGARRGGAADAPLRRELPDRERCVGESRRFEREQLALLQDYVCRAQRRDGSWEPCGGGARAPAGAARRPPQRVAEAELDVATSGHWEGAEGPFPADSLGSLSRYATCGHYLGPKLPKDGKLEGRPLTQDVMETPHARGVAGGADRSRCHEYRFASRASANASLHQYSWATRESAQQCLQGRWIAFWGDSTTRIAFSAMVDFLAGGIDDPTFPTHDWSYDLHTKNIDKCNHATDAQELACHLAAHIPESGTSVTFNWVTKMSLWPSLKETLAVFQNKQEFPNLQLNAVPDLLLINSGPWEVYEFKNSLTGWIDNDRYAEMFANFLEHELGGLIEQGQLGVGQVSTRLMVLGNTACPQGPALFCKAGGVPCTSRMADLARLQRSVLWRKAAELGLEASARYVDALSLYDPLPAQYQCLGSGFHLPAVVTDARINHDLRRHAEGMLHEVRTATSLGRKTAALTEAVERQHALARPVLRDTDVHMVPTNEAEGAPGEDDEDGGGVEGAEEEGEGGDLDAEVTRMISEADAGEPLGPTAAGCACDPQVKCGLQGRSFSWCRVGGGTCALLRRDHADVLDLGGADHNLYKGQSVIPASGAFPERSGAVWDYCTPKP
ncbi:unnamed protein product, partial [Prorocentrum cordatum]